MDKGHDRSHDESPGTVEFYWNDWLKIQRVSPAMAGSQIKIEIILKRHADQGRDGVGELLNELFIAGFYRTWIR